VYQVSNEDLFLRRKKKDLFLRKKKKRICSLIDFPKFRTTQV
jgi:hypothetical protein